MSPLSRFLEEIHLGLVHNPHRERWEHLTELVTVCPACGSLHSLRHEERMVRCTDCRWYEHMPKTREAA